MQFNLEQLDNLIYELKEADNELDLIVSNFERIENIASDNATNGFLESMELNKIINEVRKFQEEQIIDFKSHLEVIKKTLVELDENLISEQGKGGKWGISTQMGQL